MTNRRSVIKGLLATASFSSLMLAARTPVALAQSVTGGGGMGAPVPPGAAAWASFVTLPPVTWNQGMGATDASGFVAQFPLRNYGARQVWVNTATGSPNYNGMSPYPGYQMNGTGPNYQLGATGPGQQNNAFGPKATFVDALNAITPTISGEGNQFFFAEGQSFVLDATKTYISWYKGIGATYPVCFQSYAPSDPLNVAKHGRAGTAGHGARPIFTLGTGVWPCNPRGETVDHGGWVFRGLEFLSKGDGQALNFVYCQNNMLFENMVFNNIQLVLENSLPNTAQFAGFTTSANNIMRMCASYGQWASNGSHAQGIYGGNTVMTIEDCIFWHNGWKVGASRDDTDAAGGPDIFKHAIYFHSTLTARRNVIMDASAAGFSLRGDHVVHHNVIIDCPTPDFKSGGSGSDLESPSGVSQHDYCNMVLGGADINSTPGGSRNQGFACSDGTPDSYMMYCLYANTPKYGIGNNFWMAVQDNIAAQITHVTLKGNRAYAFAPPAQRLRFGGPATSIQCIDTDNVLSIASPMTNAQIYAAIGFANKQAMVNAMIADPTQPWAYALLAAAGKGFNFNFNRVLQ